MCFYEISDVTPESNSKLYALNQVCSFSYLFLCKETNQDDDCSYLSVSIDQVISNYTYVYKSTQDASLFQIGFTRAAGTFPIIINGIFSFNVECLVLDLDDVQFQLLNSGYYLVLNGQSFGMSLRANYRLLGDSIDTDAALTHIIPSNLPYDSYFINIPFSQIFTFYMINTLRTSYDIASPLVSLTSNNIQKQFSLDPIKKGFFDLVYDIKTYPDLKDINQDVQLFGLGETMLLSFKSNNTAFKNIYSLNIDGTTVETTISIAYGDETSTTYLIPLYPFSRESLYELYFVNDAQFKLAHHLTLNITEFSYKAYPTTGHLNTFRDDLPIVTFGFSDSILFDFHPIRVFSYSSGVVTRFPFGYINGGKDLGYVFSITSLLKPYLKLGSYQSVQAVSIVDGSGVNFEFLPQNQVDYNSSLELKVVDFQFIPIVDEMYILKLSIKAPYGLNKIEMVSLQNILYAQEILVSGDIYDGQYEIITTTGNGVNLKLYDQLNFKIEMSAPNFILLDSTFKLFRSPTFIPNFNVYSIYNVSFLHNDINVTNHRYYNVMYFNLPESTQRNILIGMVHLAANYLSNPEILSTGIHPLNTDSMFYAKYISNGRFQIEFYVEANSQIGDFQFSLSVASKMFIDSQTLDGTLRIKNSGYDYFGPKFKRIKKIQQVKQVDSSNNIGEIGWSLLIEDLVNGFDYGYIEVQGSIDKSMYNISITFKDDAKLGSTIYLGEYDIRINVSYPCISQSYVINQVWLYDNVKRVSYYSIFPNSLTIDAPMNPFIYYLNDTSINKIDITCSNDHPLASIDTSPPQLVFFNSSKVSLDVSAIDRELSFTFRALDLESGLKVDRQLSNPIVYISSVNSVILECKSKVLSRTNTTVDYSCTISIPFSFGYPEGLLLSVYGFINNNGMFSGFSTSSLMDLGFVTFINTTFDARQSLITGHYKVLSGVGSGDGDLYLYGKFFESTSKAYLTFSDNSTALINVIFISTSVVKIPNVKSTSEPFRVYLESSILSKTNTIIINPINYDYYINQIAPPSTFPPTLTPIPTNSPQKCKGNPVCGGPSNGKCTSQGCVCYSPWIGNNCLSQIIIVDPPIFNNGSGNGNSSLPSIEIIVPDANNSSTSTVTYKSLISIVALREIGIDGNPVRTFTFKDDWVSREIQHLTYSFYKSIAFQTNSYIQTTTSTNITVTLAWFTNQTSISFANETLVMNPSSMKYTIEISSYPFESLLNSLELVMSASIQSNTTDNDICSSREFGETTSGDNSNYIKVQVNNHSLYGRFIRRGVVDSEIRTINNIQLDKDMNPITKINSIQSFVGIQIPNYKNSAIIDPDFSVVIDSYSATSICSTSKLSVAKIVGIVIGCVAFISVILISIAYHVKKKNHHKKMIINFNNKMKRINNDI